MATRYAVANGNWNAVGTWDGGASIPTSGDNVYANGKTVTINQDITVTKISTEVCPITSVGGGGYTIATDRILICDCVSGTSSCVNIATTLLNITIIGSIYGGTGSSSRGIYMNQANITINITGNVYGGSGATGAYGIVASSSYASNTINIVGSVYGGTGSRGITVQYGTVNVTGEVYVSTYSAIVSDSISIIGAIYGGSGIAAITEYTTGSGVISITGIVYNQSSRMAVLMTHVIMNSLSLCGWVFYDSGSSPMAMYSEAFLTDPVESDVRSGTVYHVTKTGTCAIPPASSVRKDVPVDDTVGTYEASGPTVEDIVTGIVESSVGIKVLAIPDDLATAEDVAEILTAISEVTGTTPEEIVNYLLTTKLGKRLLKCTVENITGVVRRITN